MYKLNKKVSLLLVWCMVLVAIIICNHASGVASVEAASVYKISGYIDPDVSYENTEIRSGYRIELVGYPYQSLTNASGFFVINDVPSNSLGYTIRISKANYLKRESGKIIVTSDLQLGSQSEPIKMWAGDIPENGIQDNAINMVDIMEIAKYFNSASGDDRYTLDLDIDRDNAINMTDIMSIAKHFNQVPSNYPELKINYLPQNTPTATLTGPVATPTAVVEIPAKIPLTEGMIVNESGNGNAGMLVDEQVLAGDPPTESCTSTWFPGYGITYPQSAYIDLGRDYVISKIYLRDVNDIGDFTVSAGKPGSWTPLFTDSLSTYNTWSPHNVNVSTRYIRCTMESIHSNMSEIVIYGYEGVLTTQPPTSSPTFSPTVKPTPKPTPTSNPNTSPRPSLSPTVSPTPGVLTRINITRDMLLNESMSGDAYLLFDENNTVGDTPVGKPSTSWRVGGGTFYFPANVMVDLGQPFQITDIYYYDGPKSPYSNGYGYKEVDGGKFKISAGTPFHWDKELFTYTLANDSTWKKSAVTNCTTQYLQLSKISTKDYFWSTFGPYRCDANITEVVIYGKPVGNKPPKPTPPPPTDFNITVGSFIGANIFNWDTLDSFINIGFAREYHDWDKTDDMKYPNNTCFFWSDSWYKSVVDAGIIINLNFKSNTNYADVSKPANGPTTDPNSYAAHADHMFQLGARYGSTVVPSELLKVQTNNKRSGLNYVKYYEDWNEPNNWWSSAANNFSPYEYAAMASADYDGHGKTMGATLGLKNADPNAKFVMAGIANLSLDWVRACDLWFKEYRPDHKPIFDVLNFHHYCQDSKGGISPEADKLKERLKELVDYRNQNYPKSEVWLSEFGWDTNNNSSQRAIPHAGFSMYEVQGQWLIRGYLAALAAGIDRVNMFMLDENNSSPTTAGLYESCGLLDTSKNKKVSWYYISTMKNRLNTMKYIGEKDSGNANVLIYKFKEANSSQGAYVVWCPTSDGTTVNSYKLSLPAGNTVSKLVTMQDKSATGVESILPITNNTVTISVSETPIYVLVDKMQ